MGNEGVNNNKPAKQYNTLKLKGKNQSIDLEKLEGLQKTKQNESLFTKYDTNKDGVINKDEALAMRNNLQSIAGNDTISQRELNSAFGKDSNLMGSLSKLVDQQSSPMGEQYTEDDGKTTTEFTKSNFGTQFSDKKEITKNDDGSTTTVYQDGTTEIRQKDGSFVVKDKDGKQIEAKSKDELHTVTNKDGSLTIEDKQGKKMVMKDGLVTSFPDKNTSVTTNILGKTVETLTTKEGQGFDIRTKYEYKDNKTIAREYKEVDGKSTPGQVTVSETKDGHNISTQYASEADMNGNKPASETKDANNPTLKTVTNFSYDSKGNIKAETTDSASKKTTKYTDKDGKEIDAKTYDAPEKYTTKQGDTISSIIKKNVMTQLGITEETEIPQDKLNSAMKQFVEANGGKGGDTIHVMQGGKYNGNMYVYQGTEVTVPKFNFDAKPADEASAKPPAETTAYINELQTKLGDKFNVGCAKDGSIEVRDKKGNLLAEATKKANAEFKTSDDEDINTMMQGADVITKDGTIDKQEYKKYIETLITQSNAQITDANRAKFEQLIENSFTSMDNITPDGKITKAELQKNAQKVIAQLTTDLDNADKS